MDQLKLPKVFDRFEEVGGCVDFVVFDNACGSTNSQMQAMSALLGEFNEPRLIELGYRAIKRAEFIGDWFHFESGKLIKRGTAHAPNIEVIFENPTLEQYEQLSATKYADKDYPFASFSSNGPEPGSGGQFAYAFFNTPHGLHTTALEIQSLFDQVMTFLLPVDEEYVIRDWSNPKLPEVASWFEFGMEWWGVFLFTIYQPNQKRLIAMCACTSD